MLALAGRPNAPFRRPAIPESVMRKSTMLLSLGSAVLIVGGVHAGDAAADKARAKELFRKAADLQIDARIHHECATRLLELSGAEEERADADGVEVHKLESEARRLEREGNGDKTKAALLRQWAWKADQKAALDETQANNLANRIARSRAAAKEQSIAAIKLQEASRNEPDGNEKGRLDIEATLIIGQAKEDDNENNAREQQIEALRGQARHLREQAHKWREEAQRIDPENR
jgi:hypothetical protein